MKCCILLLVLAVSAHANSNEALTKLTTQVRSELSTYFEVNQLDKTFQFLLDHYTSTNDIKTAAIDMYKKVRDEVLTSEQRVQISKSIADAAESLGGVDKLKDLVYRSVDKFAEFFNPTLTEDRKQFAELEQNGKSDDEIDTIAYGKLAEYWGKVYGQKVMDVIKCSMPAEQWTIITKDAPLYMIVSNFDMTYNCH